MMSRDQLSYILGGTGVAMAYVMAISFAHFFITTQFGITAGFAALLISTIQVSILLLDLSFGQLVSRVKLVRGYHPVMISGAAVASFGLVLLYALSPIFGNYSLIAALVGFFLIIAGLSAFSVVHLGRIALVNPDPRTRAKFVGTRMLFMGVGGFIVSTTVPLIVDALGDRQGWGVAAMFAALVSFGLLMAGSRGTTQAIMPEKFSPNLAAVLRDGPFVVHLVGAIVLFGISSMIATAAPFFVSWGLGLPIAALSLLLGSQTLANMIALRLWPLLVPHFGTIGTLCIAQTLQATGLALLVVLPNHIGIVGVGISAALIGAGAAGSMTVSYTLLSELTVAHRITTGIDRSSMIAGIWMASEKIYSASGRLLAGTILGLGMTVGRSDAATMAMVTVPLALSVFGIAYYFWRGPLLAREMRRVHDENIVLQR